MKLTIDRNRWARAGADKGKSQLLNVEGNMCCLGFYCIAIGLPEHLIEGEGEPEEVRDGLLEVKAFQREALLLLNEDGDNSDLANNLMLINDEGKTCDSYKEREIYRLLLDQGIEVEFVN